MTKSRDEDFALVLADQAERWGLPIDVADLRIVGDGIVVTHR